MLQITVHNSNYIATGLCQSCKNRCLFSKISRKKYTCYICVLFSCFLNLFPCPVTGAIVYHNQFIGNLCLRKDFRQHTTGFSYH